MSLAATKLFGIGRKEFHDNNHHARTATTARLHSEYGIYTRCYYVTRALIQCLEELLPRSTSQHNHRSLRQSALRSNPKLRRECSIYRRYLENMHSESWQAHPHQANRDWHAPRAHQSVQHQRASSVDQKCQTYAQGITVEVILCKYSRHQDMHASCRRCFTSRWVLSFCGQIKAWHQGWRLGLQSVPNYPSDNRSFQRMKASQCQTQASGESTF